MGGARRTARLPSVWVSLRAGRTNGLRSLQRRTALFTSPSVVAATVSRWPLACRARRTAVVNCPTTVQRLGRRRNRTSGSSIFCRTQRLDRYRTAIRAAQRCRQFPRRPLDSATEPRRLNARGCSRRWRYPREASLSSVSLLNCATYRDPTRRACLAAPELPCPLTSTPTFCGYRAEGISTLSATSSDVVLATQAEGGEVHRGDSTVGQALEGHRLA